MLIDYGLNRKKNTCLNKRKISMSIYRAERCFIKLSPKVTITCYNTAKGLNID